MNEAKKNAGPVKPEKAHRQEVLEAEYNKERTAQQIEDLKAEAKYPLHTRISFYSSYIL